MPSLCRHFCLVYTPYETVTLHITSRCAKELNKYHVDALDFTSHFCTVAFFLTPSFFFFNQYELLLSHTHS